MMTNNSVKNTKHNKYLDLESLIDHALANPAVLNPKISNLLEVLEDAICCIKELAPEKYPKYYIKVSRLICGDYVTEDIYEYAVSKMDNVDNTHGAKITKDKILECAKEYGLVPNAMMSEHDIKYVVNMYASDTWDSTLSDEENIAFAIKAAKGFLTDPDAPQVPGRALRFLTKISMWHPEKSK